MSLYGLHVSLWSLWSPRLSVVSMIPTTLHGLYDSPRLSMVSMIPTTLYGLYGPYDSLWSLRLSMRLYSLYGSLRSSLTDLLFSPPPGGLGRPPVVPVGRPLGAGRGSELRRWLRPGQRPRVGHSAGGTRRLAAEAPGAVRGVRQRAHSATTRPGGRKVRR